MTSSSVERATFTTKQYTGEQQVHAYLWHCSTSTIIYRKTTLPGMLYLRPLLQYYCSIMLLLPLLLLPLLLLPLWGDQDCEALRQSSTVVVAVQVASVGTRVSTPIPGKLIRTVAWSAVKENQRRPLLLKRRLLSFEFRATLQCPIHPSIHPCLESCRTYCCLPWHC